jgi:multidrug efflux pump subunit AcrB
MIIQTAVRRPVAILMLFAGLVLIGFQARQRLSVDLLPAINYPNLTVITNYTDTPADRWTSPTSTCGKLSTGSPTGKIFPRMPTGP